MANERYTALITGASRGIGKACAFALARDGFDIIITYNSKQEEALQVVEELKEFGVDAQAFQLQVQDCDAVKTFFQENIKDKVDLHVLVNNAGITKDGLVLRMKDEDFDDVLKVNLYGAFTCMREATKIMSKRKQGRIINLSSVVGQSGNAGQVNYSASKAGVLGITKSLAQELGSRNITVNAVAPGFIETDMTHVLPDEVKAEYAKKIPLGRLGSAVEVAEAVAFLASDKASYITGQILAVNGGMYS